MPLALAPLPKRRNWNPLVPGSPAWAFAHKDVIITIETRVIGRNIFPPFGSILTPYILIDAAAPVNTDMGMPPFI